jgi:CHAT domain-containing protein
MALNRENGSKRSEGVAESFEVAQLAQLSSAAKSIARMAVRFATGNDERGRLVRRRQDAVDRLRLLDGRLVQTSARPPDRRDSGAETALRSEIGKLRSRLESLDGVIAEDFPSYAELANPQPQKLAEVQELLAADEALLVFIRAWDQDKTHAWVLRRDRAFAYTSEIGVASLRDTVEELREGIDLSRASSLRDLPRFDTRLAYELYAKLFAPAEETMKGVRHLFVVPDGALTGLPPGILVTAPQERLPLDAGEYRRVPWLAKRYAMTVLPSVSSLRALRVFAKRTRAAKPFVGYGDPVLDGEAGGDRGKVRFASLLRAGGTLADVDALRKLSRLPDTADELIAVSRALGAAPEDAVHLRERATEARVRRARLADYRVVSFATHGLVAGEVNGLPEPALVLTPPEVATEEDDGLLMASEVAQLKLNADWVVLSACNTAAGDSPDGEGLSGLAKSFFYAGTRALLVSHWPVSSEATVRLMTTMFDDLAKNPELGRAEALQRSMLAMMADGASPHFAHPAFWAPFVVVGEGGV